MPPELVVAEQLRMMLAQIFAGRHQETTGAAGRIADHVLWLRLHQFYHSRDDMARRAELAVLAGRGDLAQHIFVDIALGVAIAHVELVELVDHLGEQRRARNLESGVTHVARIGAAGGVELADERKNVLVHDAEHLARLEILEFRPAQVGVGLAALVFAVREDAPLQRRAQRRRLALLDLLHLVEPLDEDQAGDLLDHLQRIGEPARPEIVPDAVDLAAQFTCQHGLLLPPAT